MTNVATTWVWELGDGPPHRRSDRLAVEEPLAIRLRAGDDTRTLAVTLRTPGADAELAAGFLFAEGVVRERHLVAGQRAERTVAPDGTVEDVLEVTLAVRRLPDVSRLDRHVFTSSACGACGRTALAARLFDGARPLPPGPPLAPAALAAMLSRLGVAQASFAATGGLHAAARFTRGGELVALYEDVGRHNALDKLLGRAFLDGELEPGGPGLADAVVLVTSRASFELVHKCVMARVPVLAAMSAASSAAVEMATAWGLTLVGFLRPGRAVVYAGSERLGLDGEEGT